MTDVPDWQEAVVGAGGVPVGGLGYFFKVNGTAQTITPSGVVLITTDSLAIGTYLFAADITMTFGTGIFDSWSIVVNPGTATLSVNDFPGISGTYSGLNTFTNTLVGPVKITAAGTVVIEGFVGSHTTGITASGYLTVLGPIVATL